MTQVWTVYGTNIGESTAPQIDARLLFNSTSHQKGGDVAVAFLRGQKQARILVPLNWPGST